MRADLYTRRRLRLGALLYQLEYYAVPGMYDSQGQITLYRRDEASYVEVDGPNVRLISVQGSEIMNLEEMIARCKATLTGEPLPRRAD